MLADIFDEIQKKKMSVQIGHFPEYNCGSKPTLWIVTIRAKNEEGDTISVERKNEDVEMAIVSAYEAVRRGMTEGLQLTLPAPTTVDTEPTATPF